MEGEATPTRSVPLPEEEQELREEEWGGGARWQWPGQWMMPITSPYIFITSTKIKQPSLTRFMSLQQMNSAITSYQA